MCILLCFLLTLFLPPLYLPVFNSQTAGQRERDVSISWAKHEPETDVPHKPDNPLLLAPTAFSSSFSSSCLLPASLAVFPFDLFNLAKIQVNSWH